MEDDYTEDNDDNDFGLWLKNGKMMDNVMTMNIQYGTALLQGQHVAFPINFA
jgi:hypothetical protein